MPLMCDLCPRQCKVNRAAGETGFCGAKDNSIKISRAALHFWEEPCISGTRGSGAVFFSHCSLKCVYCQNIEISRGISGIDVSTVRLAEIMLELQAQGAHNINLVTPTHYVNHIIAALDIAKSRGLCLPIVYNTGGYEKPSVIERLRGYVDIFLTDYKYANNTDAAKYSAVNNYVEYADASLEKMVKIAPLVFEDVTAEIAEGVSSLVQIMKSGVIVRHLMLPGKLIEAKNILKRLYTKYGNSIYISIMSQYTPMDNLSSQKGTAGFDENLLRPVSKNEYSRLVDYAERLGIENAFIQDGSAASESFIPPFDLTGVINNSEL